MVVIGAVRAITAGEIRISPQSPTKLADVCITATYQAMTFRGAVIAITAGKIWITPLSPTVFTHVYLSSLCWFKASRNLSTVIDGSRGLFNGSV